MARKPQQNPNPQATQQQLQAAVDPLAAARVPMPASEGVPLQTGEEVIEVVTEPVAPAPAAAAVAPAEIPEGTVPQAAPVVAPEGASGIMAAMAQAQAEAEANAAAAAKAKAEAELAQQVALAEASKAAQEKAEAANTLAARVLSTLNDMAAHPGLDPAHAEALRKAAQVISVPVQPALPPVALPREKRVFYEVLNEKQVHIRGGTTTMRPGKKLDSLSYPEATIKNLREQGLVLKEVPAPK